MSKPIIDLVTGLCSETIYYRCSQGLGAYGYGVLVPNTPNAAVAPK